MQYKMQLKYIDIDLSVLYYYYYYYLFDDEELK